MLKNSPWAGLELGFVAEMVPELGSEGAVIVEFGRAVAAERDLGGGEEIGRTKPARA